MYRIYSFILFSTLGRLLPVFVRAWAYDTQRNAFRREHGDYYARLFAQPNFDYAEFQRSRAIERDCIILSLAQFNAKHRSNKVGA